jgi:biopolymer transport protein ExbB
MKKLIFILLACSAAWGTACPTGYASYVSITIGTQGSTTTDMTRFPMLFIGSALFKTVGNSGNVQSSTGIDVVFCTNFTGGTLLPYELVVNTYTPTTGAGEWWVQVPSVSHSGTAVIYALMNKSGASDQSNVTGTWSNVTSGNVNALGVWHFGTSSTLTLTDSSVGNATATNHSTTAIAGEINGGDRCIGSPNWVDTGATQTGLTNFSLEFWIKRDIINTEFPMSSRNNGLTGGIFALQAGNGIAVGYSNGATFSYKSSSSTTSTTVFTHVVGTHTGGSSNQVALYFNGAAQGTETSSGTATDPADSSTTLQLCRDGASSSPDYFGGSLDDIRVWPAVLTADWVLDEYNNQNAPASFYTISSLSPAAGNAFPMIF